MSRIVAVIGTAGRSESMSIAHWKAMQRDFAKRICFDDLLVSGGAAWADHLAVDAFIRGLVGRLELYLPAPLFRDFGMPRFMGYRNSAGSAANYYHRRFSTLICRANTIADIVEASDKGATLFHEPIGYGYGAMFRRNGKVATRCNAMIAYTFGEGDVPDDGGTWDTWSKCLAAEKRHICITSLMDDL